MASLQSAALRFIPNDYKGHGHFRGYTPLDASLKEIRLLLLWPYQLFDDPYLRSLPFLSLVKTRLLPGQTATYEALSYTWGSLDDTESVLLHHSEHLVMGPTTSIDGIQAAMSDGMPARPFHVTKNLARTLRTLRDDTMHILWVDALCIDQSNADERSQQVAIMRQIYKSAGRVRVWLGPSIDDIPRDANFTTWREQFASRFDQIRRGTGDTGVDQDVVDFLGLERQHFTRADFTFEVVHCFHRIFSLPWFKRVWVLQEVASNSHVIVQLGRTYIAWVKLTIMHWWVHVVFYKPLSMPDDIIRLRYPGHLKTLGTFWPRIANGNTRRRIPLYHLVVGAIGFLATDPRDRLYAMLGISEEHKGGPLPNLLAPDYNLTPRQVFINYTYWFITTSRRLDILSWIRWNAPGRLSDASLPSWVPEYSSLSGPTFSSPLPEKHDSKFGASRSPLCWSQLNSDGSIVLEGFARDYLKMQFPYVLVSSTSEEDGLLIHAQDGGGRNRPLLATQWEFYEILLNLAGGLERESGLDIFYRTITSPIEQRSQDELLEGINESDFPAVTEHQVIRDRESLWRDFAAYWLRGDPGLANLNDLEKARIREAAAQGDSHAFGLIVYNSLTELTLGATSGKYIGLFPVQARPDDIIVSLSGGSLTYVVRMPSGVTYVGDEGDPVNRNLIRGLQLVGECYLDGFTNKGIESASEKGHVMSRFEIQ